jgi:hypothetical protein
MAAPEGRSRWLSLPAVLVVGCIPTTPLPTTALGAINDGYWAGVSAFCADLTAQLAPEQKHGDPTWMDAVVSTVAQGESGNQIFIYGTHEADVYVGGYIGFDVEVTQVLETSGFYATDALILGLPDDFVAERDNDPVAFRAEVRAWKDDFTVVPPILFGSLTALDGTCITFTGAWTPAPLTVSIL